ncbi:MAG: hypothetical protein PVSMB4_10550 [Ktedonobacterales bacterium]
MTVRMGPGAFGHLLRRCRVARGLTQEALAERAGLSVRAISDLERGINRTPHKDTFQLLAGALQLSGPDRAALAAATRWQSECSFNLLHGRPCSRRGLSPPLIGRQRELALLGRHLAGEGPPLLLLEGEPGVGKSRLLREVAQGALGYGLRILEGGCHRSGHAPYAPVLDALTTYMRAQPSEQLRADLRDCSWLAHLMPELVDQHMVSAPAVSVPAEQARRLMYEAVARFLA